MPTRTDHAFSRGMGAAKAVKATLKGFTGVFKTLTEQHGQVMGLLTRVTKDPAKRADLWPNIQIELISHERGELDAVYPELAKYEPTRAMASRHAREADELEAVIQAVENAPYDSDVWGARFEHLVDLVKRHVAEEEGEIFPVAQKTIGDQRARMLDQAFKAAKQAVLDLH
jgi:hemerythrin superfamily protein